MKKITAIAIFIALAALISAPARAAGQDNIFIFGVYMGANEKDQQLKTVLDTVMKYVSDTENIVVDLKWYNDEKSFLDMAAKEELDFAYTKKTDTFVDLVVKYGYDPFLGVSLFGKKTARMCLYSRSDMKITSVDSMKGSKLVTYRERDGYYPLRKIIGDRVDGFFSEVRLSNAGMESLNMLAKGGADIALANEMNVFSLSVFNPGLLKQINELACLESEYQPGIVKHKNAPQLLVEKLSSIMEEAHKSEILKPYRNLLKTTKIRFFPVARKDYESTYKLYNEAEKNGWYKDYLKWLAAAEKKK